MRNSADGFTLMEVLIGAVLFSVIASGAMMAIMTTAKMTRNENNTRYAEASALAQQAIEDLRNQVRCDNPAWFRAADCNLDAATFPTAWIALPVPLTGGNRGTESLQPPGAAVNVRRCYRARLDNGQLAVDAQVCWKDLAGCNCP